MPDGVDEDLCLEAVAAVAEQVAEDQRLVARQARAIQRQRSRGRLWAEILDRQSAPHLLDRLRRNRRSLGAAATSLSQALARQLAREGESRRQIARRLGVTHQHVTNLLQRPQTPLRPITATGAEES